MSAGALTLVDHVLPDVPIRQFATGAAKPRGAGVGRVGPSFGGQVHRGQDLPGDVLGLDEGDQAERRLAL